MKLKGMGEDKLVGMLLRGLAEGRDVVKGPGDDCAVIGNAEGKIWRLLKTDCVIEEVHFRVKENAGKIGWKALARAISDIAAMGGRPQHALITLAISPETELKRAMGVYAGLKRCAARYGVVIVGGETAQSPGPMFISVTVTGEVERNHCVFRSGGKPGDRLFVTGRLGGSRGGRHLTFEPRVEEGQWLAGNFRVHAMMDLSDGLATDLPRMAEASECGYHIDVEGLPRNRGCGVMEALGDGEDYELLVALAPRDADRVLMLWPRKFPELGLTEIGKLTVTGKRSGKGAVVRGYDHFA
jgi:thiamine-monophosphate kinase